MQTLPTGDDFLFPARQVDDLHAAKNDSVFFAFGLIDRFPLVFGHAAIEHPAIAFAVDVPHPYFVPDAGRQVRCGCGTGRHSPLLSEV